MGNLRTVTMAIDNPILLMKRRTLSVVVMLLLTVLFELHFCIRTQYYSSSVLLLNIKSYHFTHTE